MYTDISHESFPKSEEKHEAVTLDDYASLKCELYKNITILFDLCSQKSETSTQRLSSSCELSQDKSLFFLICEIIRNTHYLVKSEKSRLIEMMEILPELPRDEKWDMLHMLTMIPGLSKRDIPLHMMSRIFHSSKEKFALCLRFVSLVLESQPLKDGGYSEFQNYIENVVDAENSLDEAPSSETINKSSDLLYAAAFQTSKGINKDKPRIKLSSFELANRKARFHHVKKIICEMPKLLKEEKSILFGMISQETSFSVNEKFDLFRMIFTFPEPSKEEKSFSSPMNPAVEDIKYLLLRLISSIDPNQPLWSELINIILDRPKAVE